MISLKSWWIGSVLSLLLLSLLVPGTFGWGKDGHHVICEIAQGYLSEDALVGVKQLLPDYAEGELSAICFWADEIRWHYHWSRPLHYVDTPDFRCNYQYCRDCHDSAGHKDMCVTGAIYNYTKQLTSSLDVPDSEIKYNLTEALMFLSHFIGDVHQTDANFQEMGGIELQSIHGLYTANKYPLHVGFIGDEGGNTITVRWYRRKTNLHHVWDTMIIESALKTYYNSDLTTMIQAIQQNITNEDISSWENCNGTVCPDPYASESVNLACKFAYRNATAGSTLGDDYFISRLPVVEKRLAQSGIRLAAVLNRIFSSNLPIAKE